jgi:catechol 2,3-dioxygenase-like lactoylglutathione lyase family enzyme
LDHIAFEVDDLNFILAKLGEKGVKPVSYMRESPRSRWTYITDPNGIWIELFQKK